MAKLKADYPMPEYDNYRGNFEAYRKAADEALDAIPLDKLITFQVADGYAYYCVETVSPPVLRFVDYMDGYRAHPALIRGLRAKDLQEMIDRKKALRQAFSKK